MIYFNKLANDAKVFGR